MPRNTTAGSDVIRLTDAPERPGLGFSGLPKNRWAAMPGTVQGLRFSTMPGLIELTRNLARPEFFAPADLVTASTAAFRGAIDRGGLPQAIWRRTELMFTMAPPPAPKCLTGPLRREQEPEHVEIELLVEVFGGSHFPAGAKSIDTGVVDEYVELVKCLARLSKETLNIGRFWQGLA